MTFFFLAEMLKKHISNCKIKLQVFTLRQRPGIRNFRALKNNLPQQKQDFTREIVGQMKVLAALPAPLIRNNTPMQISQFLKIYKPQMLYLSLIAKRKVYYFKRC